MESQYIVVGDLAKLLTSPPPLPLVDVRHDNSAPTGENPPAELPPKPQSGPGDDEVPLHLSLCTFLLFIGLFCEITLTADKLASLMTFKFLFGPRKKWDYLVFLAHSRGLNGFK